MAASRVSSLFLRPAREFMFELFKRTHISKNLLEGYLHAVGTINIM